MATFPADSVRTKNWGTEVLTDSDLEGQLDVLHTYIKDQLNLSTGHNHDGTANQGPKLSPANLVIASQAQGDVLYASSATAWARLPKGSANQVLKMKSDATIPEWGDGVTYASSAEVKTGTEAAKSVSPSTMVSHEGIIKGWINFNGTGTIAINDSYNVSGITDNGSGDYTITWDTDFANGNYAVTGSVKRNETIGDAPYVFSLANIASNPAAGSVRVQSLNVSGTQSDANVICVLAIGDR